MILPPEAHPLLNALVFTFTSPTYQRFSAPLTGAILTTVRRTVANRLRTLRHLAPGHPTDYRRVLSRAPWSGVALGCALTRFPLDHVLPGGPVVLVGDDTADGHPGRTVYGECRHRDPVRSSHAYTAWRYRHKWVVLAVLAQFPFAARRWAPPRQAAATARRTRPTVVRYGGGTLCALDPLGRLREEHVGAVAPGPLERAVVEDRRVEVRVAGNVAAAPRVGLPDAAAAVDEHLVQATLARPAVGLVAEVPLAEDSGRVPGALEHLRRGWSPSGRAARARGSCV